jgi:outer membrane protein OmpA-like peptidoglycan-associated protein
MAYKLLSFSALLAISVTSFQDVAFSYGNYDDLPTIEVHLENLPKVMNEPSNLIIDIPKNKHLVKSKAATHRKNKKTTKILNPNKKAVNIEPEVKPLEVYKEDVVTKQKELPVIKDITPIIKYENAAPVKLLPANINKPDPVIPANPVKAVKELEKQTPIKVEPKVVLPIAAPAVTTPAVVAADNLPNKATNNLEAAVINPSVAPAPMVTPIPEQDKQPKIVAPDNVQPLKLPDLSITGKDDLPDLPTIPEPTNVHTPTSPPALVVPPPPPVAEENSLPPLPPPAAVNEPKNLTVKDKLALNSKLKYANISSPIMVIGYDKDEVEPSENSQKNLEQVVKSLNDDHNKNLKIIGYSSDYNKQEDTMLSRKISLQRVIAIRKILISHGISPDRMTVQAAGVPLEDVNNKDRVDIFAIKAN